MVLKPNATSSRLPVAIRYQEFHHRAAEGGDGDLRPSLVRKGIEKNPLAAGSLAEGFRGDGVVLCGICGLSAKGLHWIEEECERGKEQRRCAPARGELKVHRLKMGNEFGGAPRRENSLENGCVKWKRNQQGPKMDKPEPWTK